jgi:hypothetical protein
LEVIILEGYFKVSRIEGEYAYLSSEENAEELFIALALLPLGIDIGTRLYLKDMTFEIVN